MPRSHDHPRSAATPPAEHPSDALTLAAVDRAQRHRGASPMPVAVWSILEHLAVRRRSAAARHVRRRLSALLAAGYLEHGRRGGIPTWALSSAGNAHLRRERESGEVPELPESPQHRAWRNARTAAAQEIQRFHARLRERVHAAERLLDESPQPPSDVWLAMGEDLRGDCRRLASASHCLREWPEPSDSRADIDDLHEPSDAELEPDVRKARRSRRGGRRNIRLWVG
jgi:hypothetical protein